MKHPVLSRPKERAPYQPFGAARLMWRSARREVLLSGAAGTGKSRAWLEKLHYCADKYAGMRGLIVRKTRESLTQTVLVTYERKVLPTGWLDNLIHFRTTEQEYRYPNGSILAIGGLDKPSKVMSSEYDFIYVPEATELLENDLEMLTTRLRNGVMPYQQLGMDCNPGPPTHWLKHRCDRGATLLLESRHEDNPTVTPEYLATLDALTGVRYLRLRKGKWAAAEGMVYESWDRNIHVVSKAQLIEWNVLLPDGNVNRWKARKMIASVDWGFTNPGVIHVYAVDGDGRMYLLREVYQTRKTIDWWLIQAGQLQQEFGVEQWFCDPAEPSYIAQFQGIGLKATGAFNDIGPGINFFQQRLAPAGDGRPRYFVYEYALKERDESLVEAHKPFSLETEMDVYVWPQNKDGKPIKEVPVDEYNHAEDCARYAVASQSTKGTIKRVDEAIVRRLRGN